MSYIFSAGRTRKNTTDALRLLQAGKASRGVGTAVWSNGENLYSYQTCILAFTADGQPILNRTRYSVTTNQLQYVVADALAGQFITVWGLPFDADAPRLRKAAGVMRSRIGRMVYPGTQGHGTYAWLSAKLWQDKLDADRKAASRARYAAAKAKRAALQEVAP